MSNGRSTPSQYAFPDWAIKLNDLCEYREMSPNIAGIFQLCWAFKGRRTSLEWIIDLANSELGNCVVAYQVVYSDGVIPAGCKEIIDMIEYANMEFGMGNILKACYRIGHCDHATREYDLNKIIYFAQRELSRVRNEDGNIPCKASGL